SEDNRSEGDDDERLEELYDDAKVQFKADSQPHHFDDLFSQELSMEMKTVWGFKAAKRLLKNAVEQPDLEAIKAHFRQLLTYANAVTSNDFDRFVQRI
ncbi:hypothetical protein AAVH_34127, partial [Aphelenchoides avenae]